MGGMNPPGDLFRAVDVHKMIAEPPPEPDWLLDGLLEYGELCWLAGRGKVGKSMVALFLADACLRGEGTFLGRAVGRVDWVLYIDAENRDATIHRRLHLAGVGGDVADCLDYRSVRGIDLGSREALEQLESIIFEWSAGTNRGLVFLDSLVALHRADEDKATEVRAFVDKLREVFELYRVTAVGLAHENRAGNLRGSLDWRNAADRILEMTKDGDGVRELKVGDVRDGVEGEDAARFRFVAETDQAGRRRLLLDPVAGASRLVTRTKADQLAEQVVLLLRGDSTLTKAKVARQLDYATDHGTFKRAWDKASKALAEEGGQSGPA